MTQTQVSPSNGAGGHGGHGGGGGGGVASTGADGSGGVGGVGGVVEIKKEKPPRLETPDFMAELNQDSSDETAADLANLERFISEDTSDVIINADTFKVGARTVFYWVLIGFT